MLWSEDKWAYFILRWQLCRSTQCAGFCYCVLVCPHQGNKDYYYLGGVNSLKFIGIHGAKEVWVEAEAGPEGPSSLSTSHRMEKARQQSASVQRDEWPFISPTQGKPKWETHNPQGQLPLLHGIFCSGNSRLCASFLLPLGSFWLQRSVEAYCPRVFVCFVN